MAASSNVRMALAIAILKSRGSVGVDPLVSDPPALCGSDGGGGGGEGGDGEVTTLRGKLMQEHSKVKRLKAEAKEMRAEIDRLQSSFMDCFVPSVLCTCFAKNTNRDLEPPGNQPLLDGDSIARFLESVRILNKKRRLLSDDDNDDEHDDRASRLAKIAHFIMELVADARGEQMLSVWLHQAVEFVKDAVTWLQGPQADATMAVSIVRNLVTKLVTRLTSYDPEKYTDDQAFDHRRCTQKVMLELSSVPLIGQNLLLATTRQLHLIAEMLSKADPLRAGVPQMLENAYFIVETIEKLCIHPLSSWIESEKVDRPMLDEFVAGLFRMKASLLSSGQMCLMLLVYVERICAQVVRQLHAYEARLRSNPGGGGGGGKPVQEHLIDQAYNATGFPRTV